MELIIGTDLEKALPAVIDWNHEQIKAELAERLTRYSNLVVTEDAIKSAKADRALLNKLRTVFEDKRKDIKKACLAPYEDFEKKAKEVVALIDKPIAAIDNQLKAFEEARREEKLEAIQVFYRTNAGSLQDVLPMERVLPAKWANVSESLMAITQEMLATIKRVSNDLGIIKAMRLPFEHGVLDVYLRTLDMSAALAEKVRLEEQAERLKNVVQEPAPIPEPALIPEPEMPSAPSVMPQEELHSLPHKEPTKTIEVRFYDTTAAFRADMRAITEKHGIRYGGVK